MLTQMAPETNVDDLILGGKKNSQTLQFDIKSTKKSRRRKIRRENWNARDEEEEEQIYNLALVQLKLNTEKQEFEVF